MRWSIHLATLDSSQTTEFAQIAICLGELTCCYPSVDAGASESNAIQDFRDAEEVGAVVCLAISSSLRACARLWLRAHI